MREGKAVEDSSLVQAVLTSKSGSHEATLAAGALASVSACSRPESEPWASWLRGRFTKTVRRLPEGKLARVLLECEGATEAVVGDSRAVALPPSTYSALPRLVARAQVSGLELPRTAGSFQGQAPEEGAVLLLQDAGLSMSTGKAAAQAAHGLWLARLASGELPQRPPLVLEASHGLFEEWRGLAAAVVVDSGLTEVAPQSATTLVFPQPSEGLLRALEEELGG